MLDDVGHDSAAEIVVLRQHLLRQTVGFGRREDLRPVPAGAFLQLAAQIVRDVYLRGQIHQPLLVRILLRLLGETLFDQLRYVIRGSLPEAGKAHVPLRLADVVLIVQFQFVGEGLHQIQLVLRQFGLVYIVQFLVNGIREDAQPPAVAGQHLFLGHTGQFPARVLNGLQFFLHLCDEIVSGAGRVPGQPVFQRADPVPGGPGIAVLIAVVLRRHVAAHGGVEFMNG